MKIVGTNRPIHDAQGKAAGYAKYAADFNLPNMAHIAMVTSTIPHGYIKAIHAESALAIPGVYGVFHCFNTSERKYNHYRSQYFQELPDEERVFNNYVRFYGDRVAAVAACDQQTAERAARLVAVEYEELPFSTGFEDTLDGRNCLPGENSIRDEFEISHGELPEEPFIEVSCSQEIARLHHAAMEPHACIADYDPYQRNLTVYSPNQAVFGLRTVLADYLQMPYHRVRVIKSTMGGSFGAKQEWFVEPVAALIATILARPVKLVYSRAEAMTGTIVRAAMQAKMSARFRADGKLLSLDADILLDAGAYIGNSGDYIRTMYGKMFRTYRMNCVHYRARVISSNTPSSGAYRGWSAPEAAIFMEHLFDAAAEKLGIDRIDLRLINSLRPGDIDEKTHLPLENIRLEEALRKGKSDFLWEQRLAECDAFNRSSKRYRRGIGVGCGGHGNTYFPRYNDYGEARLQMNEDGTVQAHVSVQDHGCGTVTMIKMIIAEVLSIPDECVGLQEADTYNTPIDYGCFSSRTTFILGRTVQDAAMEMKRKLIDFAALLLACPSAELDADNGRVYCKTDPARSLSYAEIAQETMLQKRENLSVSVQYHNETNPGVVGAHFAMVEVDTWTGYTKLLDYLAIQDIGQPINPAMCVAQIQGAVQMGCGAALREKMVVDCAGRCTESLSKYHLFLATDLPDIRVELLTDGVSSEGPFGAKSIGEVCYVPVAPAISGAVQHALSMPLDALPLDPDNILKALAGRRMS